MQRINALWRLVRGSLREILVGLLILLIAAGVVAAWQLATDGSSEATDITVECRAPSNMRPGQQVTLVYVIDAEGSVDVGLGAALYDEAGVDYSSGTGDSDFHPLQPGRSRVSRPFPIPADLPTGTYDVVAEIWPANRVGDDGVETFADRTCGLVTSS